MSNADLTSIFIALLLLVGLAQLLGYLFVKLRQPKVVGEILAGVVLGPAVFGRLPLLSRVIAAAMHQGPVLNFIYWLGLLLLMFLSGAETRQLFSRNERREVGWLCIRGYWRSVLTWPTAGSMGAALLKFSPCHWRGGSQDFGG